MAYYRVGDRVRLDDMPHDPDPLLPGALGTVEGAIDLELGDRARAFTQVYVRWDNGRTLSCVVPPDRLTVVEPAH